MFDFARADTKRECTECTVRRCVTVAANNRHTWQSATLLWTDHMHNALTRVTHRVERDLKFFSVFAQHFNLFGRNFVSNRQVNIFCWHIMVFSRHGEVWSTHCAVGKAQAVKCLRACNFVD